MEISGPKAKLDLDGIGQEMHRLISRLYPICRSITGNGFRETLRVLKEWIPLEIHEIPTGTKVFDWEVPKEWNIKEAYLRDSAGKRVIDFGNSNLHVLGYSVPVRRRVSLAELREHLFTLPESPEWIPYRTSYYREDWGFCLSQKDLTELKEDEYEVVIDTTLEAGSLTYGECFLDGKWEDEILISCHCCHPSLCNDNLSGMALAAILARTIAPLSRRYSYRFLFIPGSIGSITWLSLNEAKVHHIKHGLVLACIGDPGRSTYKKSRRGDAEIDRAAIHVLKHSGQDYGIEDFSPYGYDERQYCSPGFDLPVGCLMRTPHGRFPEYHTSADDLRLVAPGPLGDSFSKAVKILEVLEGNKRYVNTSPKCEPQLGRRGLYGSIGGRQGEAANQLAILWILNLSDGDRSLLDIAERSGVEFEVIRQTASLLLQHGLLKEP